MGKRPYQRHSATSKAAADAADERDDIDREKVYRHIVAAGADGATDDELQVALALDGNTERPRRVNLTEPKYGCRVVDSGRQRPTRRNRMAAVWIANTNGQPHTYAGPPVTWSILTTDCLTYLPSVAADSVPLTFLDSPYNEGVNYGNYDDNRPDFMEFMATVFCQLHRVAAPSGALLVLISSNYAAEFKLALCAAGWHLRQWLIWYESFGVNNINQFTRSHRHLFWMVKDTDNFTFNPAAVTRPSARQTKYNDKRANPNGRLWDSVWGINPPIARLCGTFKERIKGMPTQLPLALLRPIVACFSNPGDLVLDPMCGSATAGVAALELGRHFVGVELSPATATIAHNRLAAAERTYYDSIL